ncbi:sensor histidine kinase [Geotalea uraniireducens]|uniref:histidine kinase n=1 Tax=Geotalea uraniireducens (strain Rf4) TaxID=351605 RepID=A5GDB5_GEOUR|nr:ATP-binding protein [Geotalea uraniireducens]ABQ24434.1 GAF sensor signal transduction histidine kinase [Geotalea uraniireducens Rf4]
MTSAGKNIVVKILIFSIGLMLFWLLAEALLPVNVVLPRAFRFTLVFMLMIALIIVRIAGGTARLRNKAAHSLEIREMQRAVDKTIRRYMDLLEGAGNAIYVFNADDGILEEVNRRGTELLGFSKEEMVAMRGKDLIPDEEQEKFTSLVFRVKRRGSGHSDGVTFRRKDGSLFLGEIDARLIDLGDETVVHATVRDITFKSRSQREIRQRNHELSILNNILASTNKSPQLQTVLEVTLKETLEVFSADGGTIHLLDDDGKTLLLTTAQNVSAQLKAELEQRKLECESQCQISSVQRCLVISNLEQAPCHVARASAREGWQCITAVPLIAKNRLIGIMHILTRQEHRYTVEEMRFLNTMGNQIGIVIDQARLFAELSWKNEELLRSHRLLEKSSNSLAVSQSRLKKNLALVERANLELERLDRMKSHFIGMISHEFKTPLTSILGGTEFLLNNYDNIVDPEQRRMLEMIHNGGARLNEIVSDLLKVIKLEAGSSPVKKVTLQLCEIIESLQEHFKPLLIERKQTIVFETPSELPYFNGDREYLEEVFTELLINAMKFTPDGGEIVVVGRVADRQSLELKTEALCRFNPKFYEQIMDICYLEVEVRDSGIGIDAGEQLKIFDKFYEIGDICHHSSGKHKFQGKGTGLGLAIVKGMVEAHGGMVWVESTGASGSSFLLLLPLEEYAGQPTLPFMQQEPI